MGFLKSLQRKLEESTKNIQSSTTSPGKSNKISSLDEAYFDFEDHYENACEKKFDKIDSIETNHIDPDKNISGFKKKLELCHELEDFCASHGSGGVSYFNKNYSHLYEEIQKELDYYIENEYAEDKEYFEEEKTRQKSIKSLANKILKEIQKAGGSILQKDLRKLLPKDEPDYYNQAIKSILESGKIVKFKDGNYVSYKIN